MRKLSATLLASLALLALAAGPVGAQDGDTGTIMLMTHNCAEVGNESEFAAEEEKGEGNPVHALAFTVLACPTTLNPGDEPSDGIAAEASDFDYEIQAGDETFSLADAELMQGKLCETDVMLDANGDGEQTDDVCLDISHYIIEGVPLGDVSVAETTTPEGLEQGTLRFTPSEVDNNNDADTLQGSLGDVPIQLDTTADEDGSVMLHIYNFQTAGAGGEEMPETSTELATTSPAAPLALILLAGLIGGLGLGAVALRRRVE